MRRAYWVTTACLCIATSAQAACLDGETAFMTCQIENSAKVLRVCLDAKAVHYRFGRLGDAPDLALSEPVASVLYTPWPGVGRAIWEEVTFENEGYAYTVMAGFDRPWGEETYEDVKHRTFGGVSVTQDGQEVATLSCARETVEFTWGEDLSDAKRALGYSWNAVERQWVELPD